MHATADHDEADREETAASGWRTTVRTVGQDVGIPVAVGIVALTALTAGVGLLIEREPAAGIGAFDVRLAEDLVGHRTPTIDALTGLAAHLTGTVTVAVVWIGAMVLAAVRTRRWTIALFLLAAIGGEKLTYLFAGLIVGRPRPPVEAIGEVFSTSSFPSGHVGSAVTLYGGLVVAALWYRRVHVRRPVGQATKAALGLGVATVTLAVAFSRVWRGHHYVSDVIGGAVLGVIWLVAAWWLVLRSADETTYPIERGRSWG